MRKIRILSVIICLFTLLTVPFVAETNAKYVVAGTGNATQVHFVKSGFYGSDTFVIEEQGITVLSITHYMDEAARADRVIVLSDGKVVLDGRPEDVFSRGDVLCRVGLELPQCTAVSQILKARGIALDGLLNTPEQCADAITRAWENGQN